MFKKWPTGVSLIAIGIVCFVLGFITDKTIKYWSYFVIKKEVDLPAVILAFLTMLVTVVAAFWVARILETEKEEGRTEKNLIIDKVHEMAVLADSIYGKIEGGNISLIEATGLIKKLSTTSILIKSIVAETGIAIPNGIEDDISSHIQEINKSLTSTPVNIGAEDAIKISNGIISLSISQQMIVERGLNLLTNDVLKYQLVINKG